MTIRYFMTLLFCYTAHIYCAKAQPKIVFDSTTYRFGKRIQGSEMTAAFRFVNAGNQPLIISNTRSSCGCLVPSYPKEPIPPQGVGYIYGRYDSHRIGQFTKTLTVSCNDTARSNIVLTLTGNVQVVHINAFVEQVAEGIHCKIDANRIVFDFGNVAVGERKVAYLRIRTAGVDTALTKLLQPYEKHLYLGTPSGMEYRPEQLPMAQISFFYPKKNQNYANSLQLEQEKLAATKYFLYNNSANERQRYTELQLTDTAYMVIPFQNFFGDKGALEENFHFSLNAQSYTITLRANLVNNEKTLRYEQKLFNNVRLLYFYNKKGVLERIEQYLNDEKIETDFYNEFKLESVQQFAAKGYYIPWKKW